MKVIDIDSMVAGRELDALLAEKIMGKPRFSYIDIDGEEIEVTHCPLKYSTDISEAWPIFDNLEAHYEIFYDRYEKIHTIRIGMKDNTEWATGVDKDISMAICKAALKSIMK